MSQSKVHTCRVVISRLELLAGTLFMLVLLLLLSVQVVSRYLLSNPLVWTEEISRFIFVWLVMIGAAYVSSVQQHLALTVVTDHLKDRVFDVWMRVISVLVAVASAIVAYQGIAFVQSTIPLSSPGAGISMSVLYFGSLIGFALIFLHSLDVVIFGPTSRDNAVEMESGV